jgi:diguanylate cyclase (GGDEF)-like protein
VPGLDEADAGARAESVRMCFDGKPLKADGHELALTISLGVASCVECHASDAEDLIQAADAALYKAKSTGRNRVVPASQPCNPQAGAR